MSINLLPSGGFEITLKYGSIVKGQYSASSLKKFSILNGNLGFTDTISMLTDKASIASYLQLVLCAVEGSYTEFDVLEWIEELGGFDSEDSQKLFAHFMDGFVSKKKVTNQ